MILGFLRFKGGKFYDFVRVFLPPLDVKDGLM